MSEGEEKQMVKVAVCQKEFSNSRVSELEQELKKIPEDTDFFVTAEHSFMTAGSDPKEALKVILLANLARKYNINLIIGGYMQKIDEKNYFCNLFINRKGEIFCHQKKDKIRLSHMGTDDGVFPSEFGKIGLLICVEIEDHIIREACLKYKPKIIFNPALILARTDRHNFKNSSESISGKIEKYAVDHNVTIVRVDHPPPSGGATSQVICPDHTYYFPSYRPQTMVYEFNLNEKMNFQSALSLKAPYTIRSYFLDNTGNRFRTHGLNAIRKPVLECHLYDPMMTLVSLTTKHVEMWNFNTLKVKKTLQRKGRIQFPPNSSLLLSRKDNVIALTGTNSLTLWNGRGDMIFDIEDLSKEKGIQKDITILNFMMNGMFVGSDLKTNTIYYYNKSSLNLEKTIKLGEEGDRNFESIIHDPLGQAGRPNTLFSVSEDGKKIQEWDMEAESKQSPVSVIKVLGGVNKIRIFDNKIYFSDRKGSLFVQDEDGRVKCLVEEYECGIRDFLVFRNNNEKLIVVDEQRGAMKILNMHDGEEEGEEEEEVFNDVCPYEFTQVYDIQQLIFDGKTKVFSICKDFVRITQFQQNRTNIYLGELVK